MRVAFILPTRGAFDYAKAAAESFLRACSDGVVYAIDDASPGGDLGLAQVGFGIDDPKRFRTHRFEEHDGLTRSWNLGLKWAREEGVEYTLCGNSDLLFSQSFLHPLLDAANGAAAVGPVSNAPGLTAPSKQAVTAYLREYQLSDDQNDIDAVGFQLQSGRPRLPVKSPINGFCMLGRTQVWWDHAYDAKHVFNPANKMSRQESVWQGLGPGADRNRPRPLTKVVPQSFVFHYRSVSREGAKRPGLWMRKSA
jgi:hypothetical protein